MAIEKKMENGKMSFLGMYATKSQQPRPLCISSRNLRVMLNVKVPHFHELFFALIDIGELIYHATNLCH
jgi:hypothetical protein